MASDDEWTAPIQAEVGPDGNMWFSDWYNFIVQHNPTPQGFRTGKGAAYETELRDKKYGRVYRLVMAGQNAKQTAIKSLAGATAEQLVAALKSDNMFWRTHAQRLLVERGQTDAVPHLVALVSDQSVDAIGLNTAAIHALQTLSGFGVLARQSGDAVDATVVALKHPSAGMRRNAVQVIAPSGQTAALLESGVIVDRDPQVRLVALLALAGQPAGERPPKPQSTLSAIVPCSKTVTCLMRATAAAAQNGPLALASAANVH